MMKSEPKWPDQRRWVTSISEVLDDEILLRGYPHTQLIRNLSFAESFFLMVRGELPTPGQKALMDALLCAVPDYGLFKPGTVSSRIAVSGNPSMTAGLAVAMLSAELTHWTHSRPATSSLICTNAFALVTEICKRLPRKWSPRSGSGNSESPVLAIRFLSMSIVVLLPYGTSRPQTDCWAISWSSTSRSIVHSSNCPAAPRFRSTISACPLRCWLEWASLQRR